MSEPTPVQRSILAFIAECLQARGIPPTLREIAAHCRIPSIGSVSFHLEKLQRAGLVKRMKSASRGLEVLEHPFRLPILGRVGAGGGLIAAEDVEGRVALDKESARGAQYLLRVRGNSMTGAGILEGDLVQVRRQDAAQDGDIVVALAAGEEGVVKRLRNRQGRWQLESENPEYAPIVGDFRVVGKVVGLMRRYGR